jgi:uncharacterized damage-inducible protein DinB
MKQLLSSQYELIKSSRSALFAYCATMADKDLFKQISEFNNNCIRDMLVHNINTYISWIDNFGLDGNRAFYNNADINSLDEIKQLFEQVDLMVDDFLVTYRDDYLKSQTKYISRKSITLTLSPLELFTHVITHEFHHKGQMLTMSRLLGYIPADTDAIRY